MHFFRLVYNLLWHAYIIGHTTASVSQFLQQCEIKIKSNTICQKFVAIYFGSLAVQPRYYYILPILIKFGRCGLLPCSRMMQLILLKDDAADFAQESSSKGFFFVRERA